MSESYEGSRRLLSSSRLPLPNWGCYFQAGRWRDESFSSSVRRGDSFQDKVQLLRRLRAGLNNTSTGLRLTAWPTAGIILTITQEQVWTSGASRPKSMYALKTCVHPFRRSRSDGQNCISLWECAVLHVKSLTLLTLTFLHLLVHCRHFLDMSGHDF